MEKANAIKARYFKVDLKDQPQKSYMELCPPQGKDNTIKASDMIVVLDCSGSMTGERIRKANEILKEIFKSKTTNNLEIIRFGSNALEPVKYAKNGSNLTEQKSDLGGTNFHKAFTVLTNTIAKRTSDKPCYVLFLSDGEASTPTELFAPLEAELKRMNIPLLSVAISRHADAEVMVKLANLNGDLGMVFIKDDTTDEDTVNHFMESAPIFGHIDELNITFTDKETGKKVGEQSIKYRRGEDVIGLVTPDGYDVNQLDIKAKLEETEFSFELDNVAASASLQEKAGFICSYIINESKKVIGQFVMKVIEMDVAKEAIENLKSLYIGSFNEKALLDEIVKQNSTNGELTGKGKQELNKLKKTIKTTNLGTIQKLNEYIQIVTNNDLGNALEAYSGQKVTSKFNQRLLQLASKNQAKGHQKVEQQDVAHFLEDDRPPAKCMIWLTNNMEEDTFEELEQNEWVGNAALVLPGKVAAISPWNLQNVFLKPVHITNTAVDLIRCSNDERRKAWLSGYDAEFNTSLPLLDNREHMGFTRLALTFMKRSTDGMNEVSNLITGSTDLYNGAMPNALYTCATLSTLRKAASLKDYELAGKAFLTLLDLNKFQYKKDTPNGSIQYFDGLLSELRKNPVEFISNKEDGFLPNESRLMMLVNCCDSAFTMNMAEINEIFLKTFIRTVVDQTSQKYKLQGITGVGIDEFSAAVLETLEKSDKTNLKDVEVSSIPFGEIKEEVKLYTQSLFAMYSLHIQLRNYLTEKKLSLTQLYESVVKGDVTMEELAQIFQKTEKLIKINTEQFLGVLTGNEEKSFLQLLKQSILTLACQSHTEDVLPRHDTQYNQKVLNMCGSVEDILKNAEKTKNDYLGKNIAKIGKEVKKLKKRRKKVLDWIKKIRNLNVQYPLEALRHIFNEKSLSFTNPREFETRRKMFNFIENFGFSEEDLTALQNKPYSEFKDFQISAWMRDHKHHLNGFYLYAPDLIGKASSQEEFVKQIEDKLTKHYKGELGLQYKREFTTRMQKYLPVFCNHYFEEYKIDNYLEKLKESEKPSRDEIVAGVLKLAPGYDQLDGNRKEIRMTHFNALIKEKLGI